METATKSHLPCPDCGSSDALSEGHSGTKCFACTKFTPYKEEKYISLVPARELCLPFRGLSKEAVEFYGMTTRLNAKNEVIGYVLPYGPNDRKIRLTDRKTFPSEGNMKGPKLFGRDKFTPGQARAITVTEGEIDAASVWDMLGGKYPAVSVKGSSSAEADCKSEHAFLNSFEKIYICFDNDEPGQRAAQKVAALFDVNKVYHVKLGKYKDANDYLQNKASKEFTSAWWNAKKYQPKNIISSWSDIDKILESKPAESIASYPWDTIEEMAYGIREAEVVLIKAQEKIGKTEFIRQIEHHLLKNTDYNLAIIHLEEGEERSVRGLVGLELGVPVHLPDSNVSLDEQKHAYRSLTRVDDRVCLYTHFGSDDPDVVLDMIRYMVAVNGCKFVFLDHITMLVTGIENEDERKKLDYISTRLAMLTRELKFTLFLVSHVNEQGTTRGSKNIEKVADLIISIHRDKINPDSEIRNQTKIIVEGNRFAANSGPGGVLQFDPKTYRMKELYVEEKGF